MKLSSSHCRCRMTMVFQVTDPKTLDVVKQGDKVKFAASNVNGAIIVTAIEVAK